MNPIMVKKELPGYLADRLQEALWREALHIVNEGYASTKDLDRSIEDGPGLRFALRMTVKQGKTNFGGPFAQYSLSDRFFYLSISIQGQGQDSSLRGPIKVPVYIIP